MTAQNNFQPMKTNPTIENQEAAVSVGSDRLFAIQHFPRGDDKKRGVAEAMIRLSCVASVFEDNTGALDGPFYITLSTGQWLHPTEPSYRAIKAALANVRGEP